MIGRILDIRDLKNVFVKFFAFFLQFCLDGPSYNFGLLSKIGNPNPQTSLYFSVHVYF